MCDIETGTFESVLWFKGWCIIEYEDSGLKHEDVAVNLMKLNWTGLWVWIVVCKMKSLQRNNIVIFRYQGRAQSHICHSFAGMQQVMNITVFSLPGILQQCRAALFLCVCAGRRFTRHTNSPHECCKHLTSWNWNLHSGNKFFHLCKLNIQGERSNSVYKVLRFPCPRILYICKKANYQVFKLGAALFVRKLDS